MAQLLVHLAALTNKLLVVAKAAAAQDHTNQIDCAFDFDVFSFYKFCTTNRAAAAAAARERTV